MVRVLREFFDFWQWWGAREGVGWEEGGILDFAADPGLDVLDVGWSGEVDWIALRVDPGVRGSVRARE